MLAALLFLAVLLIGAVSALAYHVFLQQAARHQWAFAANLVQHVDREQQAKNERFMRENLDLLATRIGEMQVKLGTLEDMAGRVSESTGVEPPVSSTEGAGSGGLLIGEAEGSLSLVELQDMMNTLEHRGDAQFDLFTVMESRAFDEQMKKMLIPTQKPIPGAYMGSPFGRRIDPFTGRTAYHTGLDFQARTGTPILAAAGGVVVTAKQHAGYGNMVEVDHGNSLITRYAHASSLTVQKGDLVKRGQEVAKVGSTGRSTGPHLHFEVLLDGVHKDPMPFLRAGRDLKKNRAGKLATQKKRGQKGTESG